MFVLLSFDQLQEVGPKVLALGEEVETSLTIPAPPLDLHLRRLDLLVDVTNTNDETDEANSYRVDFQMCFPHDVIPQMLTLSTPKDQVCKTVCSGGLEGV